MTDHNPPPERRLDAATRARMRAELTEAVARDETAEKRPWLVPVLAAAAMVGVAALGAGLAFGGDDGPSGTEEIAPAGTGGADDPSPTEPQRTDGNTVEAPVPPASSVPGKEFSIGPLPDGLVLDDPGSCADEVGTVLPAARLDAEVTYDGGAAQLWTDGQGTWVLCDDWAATSDGGAPTLIGNRSTNDPASKQTYALSENYSMESDSAAQFVAGGPTLPGVEAISYTFPDGHTEDAVIKKDMWLMAYVPTSGPLVGTEQSTEPIHVEVTRVGGSTTAYDLQWGQDTCAQINHGC